LGITTFSDFNTGGLARVRPFFFPMTREQLTRYLDNLDGIITSDNIGKIRRDLMMPFDCEWNAWVRDETAAREVNPSPANTGDALRLRQELSHVTRHRDFLEGELHKRDEQLDSVKIERDSAETRADAIKSELEALKKERDEQGNYWPISELLEENKELRNKLELAVSQHKCAVERAENELRRIRQASVHCVLPAYKPQREEMWRRALAIILVKSPAIDGQWGRLSDDMRQFITGIFSLILDTLPQLDVHTTRHPSGSSEPGDRNSVDPHSERQSNSENGQTSIAVEDSTTSPVSGKPS
jgi:hypothetical protein